ncbi:MAG TPA: hypothetical protein VFB65_07930, partial [Pyrinomonadaceae bacterium]|nr:hypothetical protein [Pyrinomonadaceae bacterium]
PLFDGSTPVNLHTIALHLRQQKGGESVDLAPLFNLHRPLPSFAPEKLELTNRGRNDVLAGLPETDLTNEIDELLAEYERFRGESDDSFEAAKKYCVFHAAAVCVQMWKHNGNGFFAKPEWLVLVLDRLLTTLQPARLLQPRPHVANAAQQLVELFESNKSFSIVPIQLAQPKAIAE